MQHGTFTSTLLFSYVTLLIFIALNSSFILTASAAPAPQFGNAHLHVLGLDDPSALTAVGTTSTIDVPSSTLVPTDVEKAVVTPIVSPIVAIGSVDSTSPSSSLPAEPNVSATPSSASTQSNAALPNLPHGSMGIAITLGIAMVHFLL